ncbi:hypothetical protein ACFX1X_000160 [Malus domestica]
MQSMLQARFLPRNYKQVLFEKYHGCVQRSRTMQEYSQEFFNLAARNRLTESLAQQTARYLFGLRPYIRDKIGLQHVNYPSEAEELAISAELLEKNHNNQSYGFRKQWRESSQETKEWCSSNRVPRIQKRGLKIKLIIQE